LPDINNEGEVKNAAYKNNLLSLENFAMVYSVVDQTVNPRESAVFGTYDDDDDTKVLSLEDLDLYKKDWLGLRFTITPCIFEIQNAFIDGLCINREMDHMRRLHRFSVPCNHGDYYSDCYEAALAKYLLPFLMGTWNGTVPDVGHSTSQPSRPAPDLGMFPGVVRE